MRIATIDVGTNTSSLLVAEQADDGLRRLHTSERFVRLGAGVDASGEIDAAAQERLIDALREQTTTARRHDAGSVIVGATSAMRDAANRDAVIQQTRQTLGLSVEVLSGAEEAAWSFAAACAPFEDLTGDCLVIDVGGGSTELIVGHDPASHRAAPTQAIRARTSLDVGCVRLTERCLPSLPPPSDAVVEVERLVDDALDDAALSVAPPTALVGTAGTATALALVHAGPTSTVDALAPNDLVLSHEDVAAWCDRLLRMRVDAIRALHPEAMPGRADVFPVGVLLLARTMQRFRLDALRVSPFELRYGLVLRHLGARGVGT
jgi:exopolyphosphatase/guanosine-5'-triphosphate,3'-diphosphate pyrophosphatase